MGTTHGKKNNHINLGEIGMETFLGEQMDGEWVFLLKGPLIRAIFALQSLLPEKYSRIIFRITSGFKGGWNQPLKACGWFSGWSFPLGRCWVIKVSGWKRLLVPAQNFNFQARFFLKNSCKKTTTSEKSFFCCWKYSNQTLPTIHFWDTFLRQGFYSSTIPGNHWYKSNRIKSGYSSCTSPRP